MAEKQAKTKNRNCALIIYIKFPESFQRANKVLI